MPASQGLLVLGFTCAHVNHIRVVPRVRGPNNQGTAGFILLLGVPGRWVRAGLFSGLVYGSEEYVGSALPAHVTTRVANCIFRQLMDVMRVEIYQRVWTSHDWNLQSCSCKISISPGYSFSAKKLFLEINLSLHLRSLCFLLPHVLTRALEHLNRNFTEPFHGVGGDKIRRTWDLVCPRNLAQEKLGFSASCGCNFSRFRHRHDILRNPIGPQQLVVQCIFKRHIQCIVGIASNTSHVFPYGELRRNSTVVGLALLSGIYCIASALVRWKGLQIALEIVSFFIARAAFDLLLIYTLALFPTCVRNSAVSMVRQASLFGGILGPALAAVGRKNGLLSYGVFGATISLCGLLIAWLPETKGRILCDTMEEEECNNRSIEK
ncbi:UNVERIFIED_CONTAM: Organic cation/carnitine transporter 3 [Sesamum latifolium]|uniref:Organic cation/carnitine transporter 3 n=1 Tax=Sesamum latifolium TaxID=2727402 RepID=A0AAW2TUN7_9LAMI